MDVVLGVAVTGRVARLAMVDLSASDGQVLDEYALDLTDDSSNDLADTIVGTYRAVADSGNRVAATRLCLPDASEAETLRQTVSNAGVQNVEVVSETAAAAAVARSLGADAALLLADDDTVALTAVGEDDGWTSVLASVPIGAGGAAVACATVLQQVPSADATTRVMLVGQRLDLDSIAAELHSMMPVEVPPDPGFAIARGAAQTAGDGGVAAAGAATQMAPAADATAMGLAAAEATQMAPAAGDATQMAPAAADATQAAPAAEGVVGPLLAYSQEEPDPYEMSPESVEEFLPEQEDESPYTAVIAPPPPKTLLMGSAMAFVVMAFTSLAVAVAINIRPVADVEAQPLPPVQSDTVPGRYLPAVPHEPDPVALPAAVVSPQPAAPLRPNIPINRAPAPLNVPSAPPVVVDPGQAPVPVPEVPPVPPTVIPPWDPFPRPTWPFPTPTTTTTSPTTTTTTPTTTTTTTTTTPTTTTPTTTTTTTTLAPPPVIQAPPPQQQPQPQPEPEYKPPALAPAPAPVAPAPAPVAPAPAAVAPAPAPVQQAPALAPAPVIEAPSSGSGSSGSSGSSGGAVVEPTLVPSSP